MIYYYFVSIFSTRKYGGYDISMHEVTSHSPINTFLQIQDIVDTFLENRPYFEKSTVINFQLLRTEEEV